MKLSSLYMLIASVLLSPFVVAELALYDGAIEANAWGFRPDGTNPPGISWHPANGADTYELQVATDTEFSNIIYSTETQWSSHCPDVPFEPGTIYWRYRAKNNSGEVTEWSPATEYLILADQPHFAQPKRDALIAHIPNEHPRLMLRPEDIPKLQELSKGNLSELWDSLVADADKILAKMPDTTEPPKYPKGIDVKGEEWKKIWWGNRVHGINVMGSAATLAFVYRISGEDKYGESAHDLMMAFVKWDPKGATQYQYNDEAAMPLLYYPSRVYTWAYDKFTPEERDSIVKVMEVRGGDCFRHLRGGKHLWHPFGSHSNRAWHWLGEVGIAFHDVIDDAPMWVDYANTIFFTCYPVWGGADGAWHEGAAYWNSYIERFMYWVLVSRSAFNIDPFTKPYFKEAGYYGLYTMPPGTGIAAWGDQAPKINSDSIARLMAILAAGAKNPHWQWYAEQHNATPGAGYFGFLYGAQAQGLEAQPPDDLPESRAFYDAGIAVLNTNLHDGKNNTQIHFKASPFGRQSHGYNANNAFLLNISGEPIFVRSGRRDIHGSPHHYQWMHHAKSDNIVLIDGEDQKRHTADSTGYISEFYTSTSLDVVVGEAAASYPGQLNRYTRRIFFLKPGHVIIHDIIESKKPGKAHYYLHSPYEFDPVHPQIQQLKGAPSKVFSVFLYPQQWTATHTNEYDVPPHEWANFNFPEWHMTAITQEESEKHQIISALVLNGDSLQMPLELEPRGERFAFELQTESGPIQFLLSPEDFAIQGPGIDYRSGIQLAKE